jgi:HTH-type transcriptional regulator/antitoxin HigA
MKEHNLKAKDLASILEISKGYISDILHYKKGLSKEVIKSSLIILKFRRKHLIGLTNLIVPENAHLKNASIVHKKKKLVVA